MRLIDRYPADEQKTVIDRYSTGSRKAGNWSHVVEYEDGSMTVWFVEKGRQGASRGDGE